MSLNNHKLLLSFSAYEKFANFRDGNVKTIKTTIYNDIEKILRNDGKEILRQKCQSSRLIEPTVKGSTWLIPEKHFIAYNNFCSLLASMNIFR